VAQPSVGPNPTRRQPACAGANANTDFSTKAVHIRRRRASVVVMPRRRKTASSRVSGLLRTQRRYRRAFSLPPIRIWARRTAQIRSSGIFIETPAVFFYFWNETAGAETAGLSPAAAPGAVSCRSEHAYTSWVCAQAAKNARTAAFCMPNSVFWRHISGLFGGPETRPRGCVLATWVPPSTKRPSATLTRGIFPLPTTQGTALVALATLAKPTLCTVAAPAFQLCVHPRQPQNHIGVA